MPLLASTTAHTVAGTGPPSTLSAGRRLKRLIAGLHVGSGFFADAAKVVARKMLVKVTNIPVQNTRIKPDFSTVDICSFKTW